MGNRGWLTWNSFRFKYCDLLLGVPHGSVIVVVWTPVLPALFSKLERCNRKKPRPPDAISTLIEDRVRSTFLLGKLSTYTLRLQHRPAAKTACLSSVNCPVWHIPIRSWLEDFKFNLRYLSILSNYSIPQCPLTIGLLAQPEGTHQRDFGTAVRGFASHGSCPQVGDGPSAIRIYGIEFGKLFFGSHLNFCTNPP